MPPRPGAGAMVLPKGDRHAHCQPTRPHPLADGRHRPGRPQPAALHGRRRPTAERHARRDRAQLRRRLAADRPAGADPRPRHVLRPGHRPPRRRVAFGGPRPAADRRRQRPAPGQPRPARPARQRHARRSRHRPDPGADAGPDQGPFRRAHAALHGALRHRHHGWRGAVRQRRADPGGARRLAARPRCLGGARRARAAGLVAATRHPPAPARRAAGQEPPALSADLAAGPVLRPRHSLLHLRAGLARALLPGAGLERPGIRAAARFPDGHGGALRVARAGPGQPLAGSPPGAGRANGADAGRLPRPRLGAGQPAAALGAVSRTGHRRAVPHGLDRLPRPLRRAATRRSTGCPGTRRRLPDRRGLAVDRRAAARQPRQLHRRLARTDRGGGAAAGTGPALRPAALCGTVRRAAGARRRRRKLALRKGTGSDGAPDAVRTPRC